MRVRITVAIVEGWTNYNPGQEVEVAQARAAAWIQAGVAEPVVVEAMPETAALNRGERAARPARAAAR